MGKQPTVWRENFFLCLSFQLVWLFEVSLVLCIDDVFSTKTPSFKWTTLVKSVSCQNIFPSAFWLSYVSVRRISGGRRIWAKIGSRWKCSDRSQQRFCHHSENCISPRSNQLAGKMMMDGEEENVSLAQSFNDDKTTSGCPSKISPLNLMANTGAFQKTKLDVKKL